MQRTLILIAGSVLISCGASTPTLLSDYSQHIDIKEEYESSSMNEIAAGDPFGGRTTGDDYAWGYFIRGPFQTLTVDDLNIEIYLAFFTEAEDGIIRAGVEIANDAMGMDLFRVTTTWDPHARIIYKVNNIAFAEAIAGQESFHNSVIGYTYSRNITMDGLTEAGRVVTDWAIEIRDGQITPWVVAHELGHAMGIQQHALINYADDLLEPLEPRSLMAAVITREPNLDDYTFMMQMQADILIDYVHNN